MIHDKESYELFSNLNTFLRFIDHFKSIELTDAYYKSFNNTAPGQLLRQDKNKLELAVDKFYKEQRKNPHTRDNYEY